MNLADLFIAFQIVTNGAEPAALEDVYTNRESDGQVYLYAAADKATGVDSAQPAKIDANSLTVGFEVTTNTEGAYVDLAKFDLEDYRNAQGDNFSLLEPVIQDKNPAQVMALYKSAGLSGVVVPIEFGDAWGSWAEFITFPDGSPPKMTFTFKQIEGNSLKEVIAVSSSSKYTVSDVYSHWKDLVEQYR